ncbi:MAG: peptide ABC transporter substrate-binding protein [Candidatus Limnocylindria bacterium]
MNQPGFERLQVRKVPILTRLERFPMFFLVLVLVAAACSQPPPAETSPGSTEAAGGIGAPAQPQDIDPDGQIVTNIRFDPETIDPHKATLSHEIAVVTNVFENLMVIDPETLTPVPGAASAPPEMSPDARTFTFTLRDGLTYSDGSPLTAEDFVYSYARSCDPRTGTQASALHIIVGCAEWNTMDLTVATEAELAEAQARLGIRALDEKRIEFKTVEPAAYFPYIVTRPAGMPVRRSDIEKGGDRWAEPPTYVGNGPFKLVEWKRNESMTFERNENYRQPAKLKTWRYVMIPDPTAEFNAYRNNEIDLLYALPQQGRLVEDDPTLRAETVDIPVGGTTILAFNSTKPPFDDPQVRLAFAKSFDRAEFVDEQMGGLGRPATGFIAFGQAGHDPSDDTQEFDLGAAKQLLAESTYGGAAGLPEITLSFIAAPTFTQQGEWVSRQWSANLGVDVVVDPIANTSFQQLILDPATAPQVFLTGLSSSLHPRNWLWTTWGTGGVLASRTGYSDPDFDRLVIEANGTLDPERALGLYLEASQMLSRQAPGAWIAYGIGRLLVKPWVGGYYPSGPLTFLSKHDIYVVKH